MQAGTTGNSPRAAALSALSVLPSEAPSQAQDGDGLGIWSCAGQQAIKAIRASLAVSSQQLHVSNRPPAKKVIGSYQSS
jgi:hypothetical protein